MIFEGDGSNGTLWAGACYGLEVDLCFVESLKRNSNIK